MGARATKHQTGNTTDHGGNNLVTRFTISDESGPPLSIDQVQRPPSGMPNPRDAPPQITFLSVPAAIYADDDSVSTQSAETSTILTRSSTRSSATNLTLNSEWRNSNGSNSNGSNSKLSNLSNSTNSWIFPPEDCKSSLPNLNVNAPKSTSAIRSVSKEDKINGILHDIEESPTPTLSMSSRGETSTPNNDVEAKKPLIPPRIECTEEDEDAISKAPEVTNKREPLKTPKTYFFESLQKRRQKALTKSQSACRFLANAGPNLIRRGSTISKSARSSPESPPSANDKFTSIEKVNTEQPAPSNGLKKKLWSSNNSSSRYKERYAEVNSGSPRVQWSYNIQKDSPNANFMKRSISYQD